MGGKERDGGGDGGDDGTLRGRSVWIVKDVLIERHVGIVGAHDVTRAIVRW